VKLLGKEFELDSFNQVLAIRLVVAYRQWLRHRFDAGKSGVPKEFQIMIRDFCEDCKKAKCRELHLFCSERLPMSYKLKEFMWFLQDHHIKDAIDKAGKMAGIGNIDELIELASVRDERAMEALETIGEWLTKHFKKHVKKSGAHKQLRAYLR
jgi:hypothetical protein